MIVILDNIRSKYNVGSIFRTSDAAGVKKIYLCGITPAPVDRFGRADSAIAKVSLGAEKSVLWEYSKSTIKIVDNLKKEKYQILALEQSKGSIMLQDIDSSSFKKCAIVLGEEVGGLSKELLSLSDAIIEIPMFGRKESLNVSVAFGIACFWLKLNNELKYAKGSRNKK